MRGGTEPQEARLRLWESGVVRPTAVSSIGYLSKINRGLVLLDVGDQRDWQATVIGLSSSWRSHTPFVPPRHEKTRGRNRETPLEQLRSELQRQGFPEPVDVQPIPRCELQGRSIRWIEFRRERLFGGGSRGQGLGYGFVVEFPKPVYGPICLGYACHFGLGLFVPAAGLIGSSGRHAS